MISATTNELMKRVDSTYTLCNVVGKELDSLWMEPLSLQHVVQKKPVSIATKEVSEGKITYTKNNTVYVKRTMEDLSSQHFI